MASFSSSSSSSSSSYTPKWNYDVFVSFRGEDTRKTFTDHLYMALYQKGIRTFTDDEKLERGKQISAELLKAIEESRFSVIVLSKNYASSPWCLEELVKILECKETKGQTVLPIFYDVDPSEVRNQTGSFAQAFDNHEEHFKVEMDKVRRWKAALTEVANLSGLDLRNTADGHEAKFIQKIIQDILSKLNQNHTFLYVAKNPVGIDFRIEKINLLLRVGGSDDVRIIGIWGMGGIGKTTLAKAVYNQISEQFEGSSFLANVRKVSRAHGGIVHLQRELLSEILREANLNVSNDDKGVSLIKERLRYKRVLVILDDVDHLNQLEKLAGKPEWFGFGSRIIITTRDKHLLTVHEVNETYTVEALNYNESLQLFSLNAFKEDHLTSKFLELSDHVVNYAKGLPLALNVLGSSLCKRSIDEWKSELDKLRKSPNKDIYDILKVSYDGLDSIQKNIFLDVACFFHGKKKDYVIKVLGSCGFHPDGGLEVLAQRSLITISSNRIWMHDLLQEMGQEIVYQESPTEPGKRSRLWLQEDVYHVLTENTGTEAVEGIFLTFSTLKEVHFSNEAFARMNKLRLLEVSNGHLYGGFEYFFGKEVDFTLKALAYGNEVGVLKDSNVHPFVDFNYLSNELRCLNWHGYPSKSMPSSFHPKKLVELDMCYSRLEQLWKTKVLENLEFLNLSHSQNLIETPDLSGMPRLKILIFQGCTRLVQVHPSILVLNRLVLLNLKDCKSLRSLWRSVKFESLQYLNLSGCSKLEKFPEVLGTMEHLQKVFLNGTGIRKLPSSIVHLTGLVLIEMRNCKNLTSLPSCICELVSLEILILSGCSKLGKLPENMGNMQNLMKLYLDGTAIRRLPSSIVLLKNLESLSLRRCKRLPSNSSKSICVSLSLQRKFLCSRRLLLPPPSGMVNLSSLENLDLSKNNFVSLPASFSQLNCLKILKLEHCTRLQALPPFPLSIGYIDTHGCRSLERLPFPCTRGTYAEFRFSNCKKIAGHQGNIFLQRVCQEISDFNKFDILLTGSEIPKWFNHQSMGSSISFKVSPLEYSKIKGAILCAVFTLKAAVEGQVTSKLRLSGVNSAVPGETVVFINVPMKRHMKSDHVWLTYCPRFKLEDKTSSDGWRHFEVSFKIRGQPHHVKKCGVHIVYEELPFPRKVKHLISQIVHNILPVGENSWSHNTQTPRQCRLCKRFEESATHIFLHCPVVRPIWFESGLRIPVSSIEGNSIQEWIKSELFFRDENRNDFRRKAAILWAIWHARNACKSEGTEAIPSRVLLHAKYLVAFFALADKTTGSRKDGVPDAN